jgi:hypothetical protein
VCVCVCVHIKEKWQMGTLVDNIKGIAQTEGVRDQGAENIWTSEG